MVDLDIVRNAYVDACDVDGFSVEQFVSNLHSENLKIIEAEVDRGDNRKAHYGAGRQPLDDILEAGWAPGFCAGNVLKYLRRAKDVEHSRESARFYWNLLHHLADIDKGSIVADNPKWKVGMALQCWRDLLVMLTAEELAVVSK